MIRCYTTLFTAPADRAQSLQAGATEAKLQAEQRASTKLELLATPNVGEAGLGRSDSPAPTSGKAIGASGS